MYVSSLLRTLHVRASKIRSSALRRARIEIFIIYAKDIYILHFDKYSSIPIEAYKLSIYIEAGLITWFVYIVQYKCPLLFNLSLQARIVGLNAKYFLKVGGYYVISIKVCLPYFSSEFITSKNRK